MLGRTYSYSQFQKTLETTELGLHFSVGKQRQVEASAIQCIPGIGGFTIQGSAGDNALDW